MSPKQRFARYTIPEPNSGCLLWLGVDNDGRGNARFNVNLKSVGVRRWVMEEAGHRLNADDKVIAKCGVSHCVELRHLEAISPSQKKCTRCWQTQERTEFYTHGSYLHSVCKTCYPKENAKYRYGVPDVYFEGLLEKQNGVCAICRQKCSLNARLSIDHDHGSGDVRGLLCKKCNLGLGYFGDDLHLLLQAAAYLREYKELPTHDID